MINYSSHRMWIYCQIDKHASELWGEFISGVKVFDIFMHCQQEYLVNNEYRCPCTKCKNANYLTPNVVKLHLYKKKVLSEITDFEQVTERLFLHIIEKVLHWLGGST